MLDFSPKALLVLVLLVIACAVEAEGPSCEEGQTRESATACGLNEEGVFMQDCTDGQWVDNETCTGTDICRNGGTQEGATVCGLNEEGVLMQDCTDGQWADGETCTGTDVCVNGDTREGAVSCGDNSDGVFMQDCVDGAWVDSDRCSSTPVCLGSPAYCDRPYNEFTQVCTHNAMASEAYEFFLPWPNQIFSIPQQLDDGVRCLMIDTYESEGELLACHGLCALGSTPLVPLLEDISDWLEEHPDEIVTLIIEAHIDEDLTRVALQEAGLMAAGDVSDIIYFHDGPPGTPWPTLGAIIDSGRRLVVFSDEGGIEGGWHLDWRAYGWETPFGEIDSSCEPGRGTPGETENQVFVFNHYSLCDFGGCEEKSLENNSFEPFFTRAKGCWATDELKNPHGQIPTFLVVDHYHVPNPGTQTERPDVFDVADALNAAWPDPAAPQESTE
ncbi:MAG: hypothetical protein CMH54_02300 [Myxococcales bacterium]|nr:hypothetical protein [Myxococcales bacterium]